MSRTRQGRLEIGSPTLHRGYPQHKDYFEDLRTLYPAGEYGTPRDVAELALFLASDQAKFMNGSVIAVDGALSAVHNLPSCVAPSPKQG